MQLKQLLQQAAKTLLEISDSARLDAELLLCEAIKRDKTFLYSYPEYTLSSEESKLFQEFLQQRQQGRPIAYILGRQEFWDLELAVGEGVLIPRPETECLLEKVLELLPVNDVQVVADLGTGSGAIALALAKECPAWSLYATDVSDLALKQAQANAQKHTIKNIAFLKGSWCEALPKKQFDCIISNPPYIAEGDPELEKYVAEYEPKNALIAGENGLQAIKTIVIQARTYLKEDGHLVLEHGYLQAQAVQKILLENGYKKIISYKDFAGKLRFTIAQNKA